MSDDQNTQYKNRSQTNMLRARIKAKAKIHRWKQGLGAPERSKTCTLMCRLGALYIAVKARTSKSGTEAGSCKHTVKRKFRSGCISREALNRMMGGPQKSKAQVHAAPWWQHWPLYVPKTYQSLYGLPSDDHQSKLQL